MQKTYKRQRRRMFWLIFAFVFVTCAAVIGAYSVIVYNNTKEDLIYSADAENSEICTIGEEYEDDYLTYVANYFINSTVAAPTGSDCRYVQLQDVYGSTLAETGNVFTGNFTAKEDTVAYEGIGIAYDENGNAADAIINLTCEGDIYIEYEDFRASMTDEQYDKICKYLQSTPEDKDMYYELLCTKFYKSSSSCKITPKTVEIVETCEDFTWYVEDEHIESFELSVEAAFDENLYEIDETGRNVIDTDFVLGNRMYDYTNIRKQARRQLQTGSGDGYSVEQTGAFTYLYVDESNFNSYDITFSSSISDLEEYHYSYEYADNITVIYARQFNVLDACAWNIIWVSLIILAFFVVMGFILEFAVIHTLNTRVRQEQKRVEMTNAFAHNMKTPIQVITGFAENMSRKIQTDEARRYTEVIKRQAFSMDKLVHRMLDYTHIDSGSVKPNKTEFAMNGLVEEIISANEFSERDIAVSMEPTVTVNADRELLGLALENLIENAVKYSPEGSIVSIFGKQGRLEILNPCENISKADLKRLWQPYFRLNQNNEKGNGLGLSIVAAVMKLHKFDFGAETENDVITFYFEF